MTCMVQGLWRAPALMVVSGLSLYAGAAVAVGLFLQFPPVIVAWFRMAGAGVLLLVLFRPRKEFFTGRAGLSAAIYGLATMGMNMAFYQAINTAALGTAVAIEFLGPVLVAAWGSRNRRDWAALVLATAGVLVISGATWTEAGAGIIWALAAGLLWALYIVTGARVVGSATDPGGARATMAVGFSYAAACGLPLVIWLWPNAVALAPLPLAGLALALGLLSAAIPYTLDQTVLRIAGSAYFALLQAILPLVAAIVGAVALRQWLSWPEVIGIALVVLAVGMRKP